MFMVHQKMRPCESHTPAHKRKRATMTVPRSLQSPGTRFTADRVTNAAGNVQNDKIDEENFTWLRNDLFRGYEWKPPIADDPKFGSIGDSEIDEICDVFNALSRAAADKKCNGLI